MWAFDTLCEHDPRFADAIRVTGYSARDILTTFARLRQNDYSPKEAVDAIFKQLNPVIEARRLDSPARRVVR
jgi:hypothetical protein